MHTSVVSMGAGAGASVRACVRAWVAVAGGWWRLGVKTRSVGCCGVVKVQGCRRIKSSKALIDGAFQSTSHQFNAPHTSVTHDHVLICCAWRPQPFTHRANVAATTYTCQHAHPPCQACGVVTAAGAFRSTAASMSRYVSSSDEGDSGGAQAPPELEDSDVTLVQQQQQQRPPARHRRGRDSDHSGSGTATCEADEGESQLGSSFIAPSEEGVCESEGGSEQPLTRRVSAAHRNMFRRAATQRCHVPHAPAPAWRARTALRARHTRHQLLPVFCRVRVQTRNHTPRTPPQEQERVEVALSSCARQHTRFALYLQYLLAEALDGRASADMQVCSLAGARWCVRGRAGRCCASPRRTRGLQAWRVCTRAPSERAASYASAHVRRVQALPAAAAAAAHVAGTASCTCVLHLHAGCAGQERRAHRAPAAAAVGGGRHRAAPHGTADTGVA
jgi:hypothetical protein